VLVTACAVLVLTFGAYCHAGTQPVRLDDWVYRLLPTALRAHQRPLSTVADLVPGTVTVIAVVLAGMSARSRRWRAGAFALLAPVLTTLVTEALKHLFDRRIHGGGLAYPSGHTAGATSILLVLALTALVRTRSHLRATAVCLLIAVTVGAAAVGVTMVSIHAHYPTDTVAGYCTATAVTLGLAFALDGLGARARADRRPSRTLPHPPSPAEP
jgi:undecaprenyl-diphosphatase